MVSILANKYARAFFNLYSDKLRDHEISALNKTLLRLRSTREAIALMHLVPSINQLHSVLDRFFDHLGLDELLHPLVILLAKQRRLWLIADVLEAIIELYNKHQGIVSVSVSTAQDIPDYQKKQIDDLLIRRFGKHAQIIYRIDEKLIAGIRIEAPEVLWEHSIDNYIRSVGRSLGVVYRGN